MNFHFKQCFTKLLVFYIPSPRLLDIEAHNSFCKTFYEMKIHFRSHMYIWECTCIIEHTIAVCGAIRRASMRFCKGRPTVDLGPRSRSARSCLITIHTMAVCKAIGRASMRFCIGRPTVDLGPRSRSARSLSRSSQSPNSTSPTLVVALVGLDDNEANDELEDFLQ